MSSKHKLELAGLLLLVATGSVAIQALASAQSGPPDTPIRPVAETLHGVEITDPYRWMESGGDELTTWLKAQDAYTRSVLARIPGRDKVLAEMRELNTDATTVTQPRRVGRRYFYLKRNAGERVASLYVRDDASGPERRLVEPSAIGDGGSSKPVTIMQFVVAPDGRHVAVLAAPGTNVGTVRVIEIASGRVLPDTINRAFGIDSWRPDGRAFTYVGQRTLPAGVQQTDPFVCPTAYLHVVGSVSSPDSPLIGCGVSPRVAMTNTQFGGVSFFAGSRYALAWVALNTAMTSLALYTAPVDALAGPKTAWRALTTAEDEAAEAVIRGDTVYVLTSRNAPRRRIVRTSVEHPDLPRAAVAVPEREAIIAPPFVPTETFSRAMYLAKDALYVRVREPSAVSRLLRVPFDMPHRITAVALPFDGQLTDLSADPSQEGVAFELQSWTRAPRVYAFDPRNGRAADVPLAPPHPAEREGFGSTEVMVRSADGTRVPLTIIGANTLRRDGSHPTMVQGYGAYGAVTEPTFRPWAIPRLERGAVDALCHVRGGGEYGEAWHRAGQKENKPNTIADFIACAEYMVAQNYTTRARLAGFGASAGGITIGGAITQRPDLFAVALPTVPVSDMLRFEFSAVGPMNIPEFGSVKNAAGFRALLAVSPYHRIVDGTRYPAVLVSTAIDDTSVAVWHPAKLAARLQAATASGKPVLLRVDWGSGHFGGATTSDQESLFADMLSFMLWQTGVPEFQPRGRSQR